MNARLRLPLPRCRLDHQALRRITRAALRIGQRMHGERPSQSAPLRSVFGACVTFTSVTVLRRLIVTIIQSSAARRARSGSATVSPGRECRILFDEIRSLLDCLLFRSRLRPPATGIAGHETPLSRARNPRSSTRGAPQGAPAASEERSLECDPLHRERSSRSWHRPHWAAARNKPPAWHARSCTRPSRTSTPGRRSRRVDRPKCEVQGRVFHGAFIVLRGTRDCCMTPVIAERVKTWRHVVTFAGISPRDAMSPRA
ncbi:hypothetical protein AWB75_06992 [Caballeronia catudaia]|uniref:Uncharacterized protein n=1 Tax=Caballeronia catudaia TaxID=1777136 RepID=A0A158DNP3_9BURK|nr:hypothetical protein AWB75_06992 [Caballeronia catudaia]